MQLLVTASVTHVLPFHLPYVDCNEVTVRCVGKVRRTADTIE